MMWTEKYRPQKFEDMIGNDEARSSVIKWLKTWMHGKKPLLILGPPGVGKTSFVQILSKNLGFDLIEMNASDSRTRNLLESRVVPMLHNTSVLGKRTLLFLDEVDGIYRRQDTGGMEFLAAILKEPTIPIILTSNSRDQLIKELVKNCKIIEFHPLSLDVSKDFLSRILYKEGFTFSLQEIDLILKNSQGDIRSLLNTAQSAHAQYMTSKERLTKIDIRSAVDTFFSDTSLEGAKEAIARSDFHYADPRFGSSPEERRRDIMYAFFTSIVSSRRLDITTKANLLEFLSSIDVRIGRVFQTRNWRSLRFLDEMLLCGVYTLSRNRGLNYSQYNFFWPTISQVIARSQGLRSLLSILARELHSGRSICGSQILPYFVYILSFQERCEYILSSLDLDQKQISILKREIEGAQRLLARTKLRR